MKAKENEQGKITKEKRDIKKEAIKTREQKGITLIALIITIIIMLILAGVTINIALGDNGLFSKSKEAVEIHKEEAAREKVSMAIGEYLLDINKREMIEEEKDNHLKEILSNVGKTSETSDDKYYEIDVDGNIFWVNKETQEIISKGKTNGTAEKPEPDPEATTKRAGDITITPKYDYGKVVTGYNSKTSGITWRLFYVDNPSTEDKSQDTVYLIGDFITTAQAPTKTVNGTTYTVNGGTNDKCSYFTNMLPAYTHNASTNNIGNASKWIWDNNQAIATKWLSQWYNYGSHKTTGDNYNMKSVAYMMDSAIWTNALGDTANKANYVLGGPTTEMYCASYKDSHPSKYLESRVNGDKGYEVAWNDNGTIGSFDSYQSGVDTTGNNKIYAPGKGGGFDVYIQAMWVSSPSSSDGFDVMIAEVYGEVAANNCDYTSIGFCPVVSLKSGVQIEVSGDGFRIR